MPQPEQAREFVTTHFDRVLYTAKAHTTGGRPRQRGFPHRRRPTGRQAFFPWHSGNGH
jgi:hypothetical protein